MISNYHTHTTFCDGVNTPEEIILYAIDKGFSALGFSGHGYTPFDLRYCMQDTEGYIETIKTLKEKYKNKISVYLGVEEDAFNPLDRKNFDYIIGSSHYFKVGDKFYPIDSDYDYFKECLNVFNYDVLKMADVYYGNFVDYIIKRKPDIVGHFDLITKFDELDTSIFFSNFEYMKKAEKYIETAASADVIFEVNTGAISRGYRTSPYPAENLLYVLKKNDGKLLLSSDSHNIKTLDFNFEETKKMLKDVGFEYIYELQNNEFIKIAI